MMKKLILCLVALAAALALLVPVASTAAPPPPYCVIVDGPNGFHLQIGFAPNGTDDCTHVPG
jgi:hypothetical protein